MTEIAPLYFHQPLSRFDFRQLGPDYYARAIAAHVAMLGRARTVEAKELLQGIIHGLRICARIHAGTEPRMHRRPHINLKVLQ